MFKSFSGELQENFKKDKKVESMVRLGAVTKQVMENNVNSSKKLTKHNYVVFWVGANDVPRNETMCII